MSEHTDKLKGMIKELPAPLALVLHEYLAETGSYLRLHRMCAALEITCRFLTTTALADLRRLLESRSLPVSLEQELLQHLGRPTLASWRVLLERTTQVLSTSDSPALPGFAQLAEQLIRRMGSGRDDPLARLLPMRNELAHGGRLSDHRVEQLLGAHDREFCRMMLSLAPLAASQLVATTAPNRQIILRGLPGDTPLDPGEFEASSPLASDSYPRLFLETPAASLDLCPLDYYGDVLRVIDGQVEPAGETAIQVYSRRLESGGIEFTALGGRCSVSRATPQLDLQFRQMFPLAEWSSKKRLRGELAQFDFRDRIGSLTSLFVGRDRQLAAAAEMIQALEQGIVWIGGKPGMGKSAFAAKLIRQHLEPLENVLVIPYFFVAAESGRCRIDAFVKAAILQLLVATGSTGRVAAETDQRLQQLRSLAADVLKTGKQKVVFVLDAIDEVSSGDPSSVSFIFDHALPHVVWVCTGRDEPQLIEQFTRQRCHWLFPEDGLLPPLSSDDVRGFLIEDLGHRLPDLFVRDQSRPDKKGSNPFIDVVLARSGGLPLYLKLLVDQLRAGTLDFGPGSEARLPRGLKDYYDILLEHPDLKRALWAVLALLSQAKQPLSFDDLREALPSGSRRLADALRLGHVMLKQVTQPDGEPAYELYHHSFRQHLNESESFGDHVRDAKRWLADYCWAQYEQGPTELSDYARTHLPAHLRETGRFRELQRVIVDSRLNYIERWIQRGNFQEGMLCLEDVVDYLSGQRGRSVDIAVLATALARMCTRQARYDEAKQWLDRTLASTSWLSGRRARAVALHELGSLRLYASDFAVSERCFRAALRLCRFGVPGLHQPVVFHDEVSANLVALATVAHNQLQHHKTISLAKRAARSATRARDMRHRVAAESLRAASLRSLMRLEEAQQLFAQTEKTCRDYDLRLELGNLLLMRGWMEYAIATIDHSPPRQANSTFKEAQLEFDQVGYVYGLWETKVAEAWCALACRDLDRASAAFGDIDVQLPADRHQSLRLDNQLGRAAVLHGSRQLETARSRYLVVFQECVRHNKLLAGSQAKVGEGACLWHSGQRREAEEAWAVALDLARRTSQLHHEVMSASIAMCRKDATVTPR